MAGILAILLVILATTEQVLGQAKAPPPVVDVEAGHASLIFQWKPPSTPSKITGYKIQYIPAKGKKKLQDVDEDVTEYVLQGLKPETQYKVRMMAVTADRGTGRPSGWKTVTTLEERVVTEPPPTEAPTLPNPPQNLAAQAESHTARITWDEPRDNGVPVLGYIITYGPRSNPRENILSVDVSPRVSELTELDDNVQYRLTMTAFNTEGQSNPATLDFFTIEEIVKGPPPQVLNMQFTAISSDRVRVTWTLPETTELNVIESITIGYGDLGAGFKELQTANIGKGATNYDIDGLAPSTRYTVMVLTENQYGDNGPVELIVETREEQRIPEPDPEPELEVQTPIRTPNKGTSTGSGPPSQIQNIQYTSISSSTVEISWTLPSTSEVDDIAIGFGAYGIPPQFLTMNDLGGPTERYVADNLTPGGRYTAMVIAKNRFGESDPVVITVEIPNETGAGESSESSATDRITIGNREEEEEEEVIFLNVPTDVHAEVLTTTTVRLYFVDTTLKNQSQVKVTDRYYTVRYKHNNAINYQYAHLTRTNDVIRGLLPETTYQFEVKVVRGINGHSLYSVPISIFTQDPNHADQSQDVTIVQLKIINAHRVMAIINWLPPQNRRDEVTGYVLQYTSDTPSPTANWTTVDIHSNIPEAKIDTLRTATSYFMRVAHVIGNEQGAFSNPPDSFTSPGFTLGQPYDECPDGEPTPEQIIERVNWMHAEGPESRTALLGVPLPFCDDYYARHECHGLVCFCVPGKSPPSSTSCHTPDIVTGGVQGDQPLVEGPPCRREYEAALREMSEARAAGKPLNDVHLPYCTDDGYFQPKQCLGSLCYCATREGQHTGKEVPLWRVESLDC